MVVLFLLIGCLSPRDQPPVPQRAKQARLSTEEDAMRSKAVEKIVTIIRTRTASLGWNKKPWIVEITLQLSCYYCFMKEEHRFTFQGPLNSSRCILWPHRNTKSLYTNFRLDFATRIYTWKLLSLRGVTEGYTRRCIQRRGFKTSDTTPPSGEDGDILFLPNLHAWQTGGKQRTKCRGLIFQRS